MLHEKVSVLLNSQINKEFFSSYLYLDMANYYAHEGLNGFSNWFEIQAKEELDHALLMYRYLHNNGSIITFETIEKPSSVFKNFKSALLTAFEHEKYVTNLIHNIYDAAYSVKDFRTIQFLDWFVKEQGEEEKNTEELIKKFDLFGSDSKGLYMLDSEMAARVYTPPSLVI